ncbi:hypothetical protein E2562_032722 [Oryza meyeriana var. granulata]|uniref:Uncharacterized protein n=1 Tax=Oryza meyeriana var. granulata TaxID=110450 RepID=A0A6G1ERZ4_9ORYZ|nr:hypothetical protein E2562_032722 [Oryza meyeriana var. granulata]
MAQRNCATASSPLSLPHDRSGPNQAGSSRAPGRQSPTTRTTAQRARSLARRPTLFSLNQSHTHAHHLFCRMPLPDHSPPRLTVPLHNAPFPSSSPWLACNTQNSAAPCHHITTATCST